MSEEWMPPLQLSLSEEESRRLPRHPAYQYDYIHGTLFLTPRPKYFHGVLEFSRQQSPPENELAADLHIRQIEADDRTSLPAVFASAFETAQPFSGLDPADRLRAATAALEKTWVNGDGPVVTEACFSAIYPHKRVPLAAILITLVPGGDPSIRESYRWPEPRPSINPMAAQPHLTWIFVAPVWKYRGIASLLLDRAVKVLLGMGYASLWSTFLVGNDASALWHWRNGFTLAPYPYSKRKPSF